MAALVFEVLLKMIALSPRVDRYFRDGWNAFDLLTISFLIVSLVVFPSVASYGVLIISARLLRLLRGLATVEELRLILSTLFRTIPSMLHIAGLLGIVIYVYVLFGFKTFGENDPERWGTLGGSVLSLFQVVTMDDWGNIMRPVVELQPLAWVYFVSFIVISAYVVANLLIAVVIGNLDNARQDHSRTLETTASKEEILRELRSTQQALHRLGERVQRFPD